MIKRVCKHHGLTEYARERHQLRCKKCRSAYVTSRRKKVKTMIVEAAGGKCKICGYHTCITALEFHHRDPAKKKFHLGHKGFTRSFTSSLKEAKKCILLCANCHREVEAGITLLPVTEQVNGTVC